MIVFMEIRVVTEFGDGVGRGESEGSLCDKVTARMEVRLGLGRKAWKHNGIAFRIGEIYAGGNES